MIPKRIELENFLSFGKPAVEFTFTDDEPLWVICGRNGAGKSAVFDGITYALYAEHRGGTQKADQLIRHGANWFRVVFDFEFAGVEYRITRIRAGRTTQKVERRIDGEWVAISGVNSAAEVKAWVEQTLGLGYKAFTTSVLLRQGEADKLFSASRDDRVAVLKGIIGFERFEEVSRRVHAAATARANILDTLRQRYRALVPVTLEELAAAEVAVTKAEEHRQEAQTKFTAAIQRVEQAKQWEGLEAKRIGVEQQLAAADKRAADSATIRADKARLDDLAAAVPMLKSLVVLRARIAELEPKLIAAKSDRDQTVADIEARIRAADNALQKAALHKEQAADLNRRAKALGEAIEHGTKFLQLADTIEELKARLTTYPADLADQLARAGADEKTKEDEKTKAKSALVAAETLLHQACEQQERFARVEVGVTCFHCGQLVNEQHAAKERDRLTIEIQTGTSKVEQLRTTATAAEVAHAAARDRRLSLQKNKTEFDKNATEFTAKNANLMQLGGVADAAELRSRLSGNRQEKIAAEHQAAAEQSKHASADTDAKRLDAEKKKLDTTLKIRAATVVALETDLAARCAERAGIWERLSADWQARFATLDTIVVTELAEQRDQLIRSDVAAKFELLRKDDAKREEWLKQHESLRSELDVIPFDARLPAKEALRRLEDAKAAVNAANDARDITMRARDELKSRAEEYEQLTGELRMVERENDLHKKLDDLLGQNRLQRELVRDAEQQIVALANDTLQNLSDGDLSLEQDDDATGRDDKAFALRVRRVGDPLPIGVLFLSGSQKFRVAVSVALAVGRFAGGRARPLEAVIIDEGFGSLDKDGLRAMAEELKRLQRSQSLRRVVLVSHQDEFTDQFTVGYRLNPHENGATAVPFRR